ncbi:MAG: hypothetical protein Q7U44_06235 [Desulfuromonadales bacterium]|nr:hypothetical protein [Desulfuromonadales bacterium]
MKIEKFTKFSVAIKHLETSILLFLENKDFFCSLTLSGAAEEILGEYAVRAKKVTMVDLICASLREDQLIEIPDKKLKFDYLNKTRNSVKHFNGKESEIIECDPESESIIMLLRAIGNLYSHDETVTHNTPDFLQWVYENRRELLHGNHKLSTQITKTSAIEL